MTTEQRLLAACVDYRAKLDALERKNAALKQALDTQMQYQRDLRADRDRLDWLISKAPVERLVTLTSNPIEARKLIDQEMEWTTV